MTRHASTALLAAAVVLAFGALAAVLLPADPAAAVSSPAVRAAVHVQEADPFLAALAPSSDFTPEQAAALSTAADLVCEGFTADVPVTTMETTLAEHYALTAEEAHRLVQVAAEVRCFPGAAAAA